MDWSPKNESLDDCWGGHVERNPSDESLDNCEGGVMWTGTLGMNH